MRNVWVHIDKSGFPRTSKHILSHCWDFIWNFKGVKSEQSEVKLSVCCLGEIATTLKKSELRLFIPVGSNGAF